MLHLASESTRDSILPQNRNTWEQYAKNIPSCLRVNKRFHLASESEYFEIKFRDHTQKDIPSCLRVKEKKIPSCLRIRVIGDHTYEITHTKKKHSFFCFFFSLSATPPGAPAPAPSPFRFPTGLLLSCLHTAAMVRVNRRRRLGHSAGTRGSRGNHRGIISGGRHQGHVRKRGQTTCGN